MIQNHQDTFQPPAVISNGSIPFNLTAPISQQTSPVNGIQTITIPSLAPYQYIAQAPVQFVSIPMPQANNQTIMHSQPNVAIVSKPSLFKELFTQASPQFIISQSPPLGSDRADYAEKQVMRTSPPLSSPNIKELPILKTEPDRAQIRYPEWSPEEPRKSASPLPPVDLDKLVKMQEDSIRILSKRVDKEGVESAQETLMLLITWAQSIPAFVKLPRDAKQKCLKNCWAEQILLSLIYRRMKNGTHDKHSTEGMHQDDFASVLTRLAKEVGKTVKHLKLNSREVVCLQLLLLFNAGK